MKNSREIDNGEKYIGFKEAIEIINSHIRVTGEEELPPGLCAGRIAASDHTASVSYPSTDVSLKDGYAVNSLEAATAAKGNPVTLEIDGDSFAGVPFDSVLESGRAVRVCSGAVIPGGADAVVPDEFCDRVSADRVLINADTSPGRNIMAAGSEVRSGATVISKGEKLEPGSLGLAAAAGIGSVRVIRRPRVSIISIGDEVVKPGRSLNAGQLYASNMVTMEAWLFRCGITAATSIVPDDRESIMAETGRALPCSDIILTSGGAWGSERDLSIKVMDELGWDMKFHYLRMGPGKGVAFGLLQEVPVFCLPGGPSSNNMAFLQLALPAILRMAGEQSHPLSTAEALLTGDVRGRHIAWTEFKDAVVTRTTDGGYSVSLYKNSSRLQSIASANSLICIPEGIESLKKGELVQVQFTGPLQ